MALDKFLSTIEKRLGQGIVVTKKIEVETISSGSLSFDIILEFVAYLYLSGFRF